MAPYDYEYRVYYDPSLDAWVCERSDLQVRAVCPEDDYQHLARVAALRKVIEREG